MGNEAHPPRPFAHSGAILPRRVADWVEGSFPNLTTVDVGKGLYFIQEDHPRAIGRAIAEWLGGLQETGLGALSRASGVGATPRGCPAS